MGRLQDKVAIVTGAGRGIGRAICEEFAKEGALVAVTSRTQASVDALAAEIRAAGGRAIGLACDVFYPDQIAAAVERTVAEFGGADVLVNNAQGFGTQAKPEASNPFTRLEDMDDAQWSWVFQTGVTATLKAMQAVFPHMKAAGGGSIINFGSRNGIVGAPVNPAYNANKEAIRGLSRTAANGWGRYNIRVNVINPAIETDAAINTYSRMENGREVIAQAIPLKRWGQVDECARVAVFLAGSDSSFITGQTLMVEGGMTTLP